MKTMEETYGIVFVAAAGNQPVKVNEWPALVAPHLEGMLVVGATTKWGARARFSAYGDLVHAWAPGQALPSPPGGISISLALAGTSFCKPSVCTVLYKAAY